MRDWVCRWCGVWRRRRLGWSAAYALALRESVQVIRMHQDVAAGQGDGEVYGLLDDLADAVAALARATEESGGYRAAACYAHARPRGMVAARAVVLVHGAEPVEVQGVGEGEGVEHG